MGYALILALSVGVGVVVYRATAGMPAVATEDRRMWVGAAPPAEPEAPPAPPTNFDRLSISREPLTWHDRVIGVLGLALAVAIGAAVLASAVYLVGRIAVALLEKAGGFPA